MLKAAFIGAGNRATRAHYPALTRAAEKLEIRAICDLDEARLDSVAERFDIGSRYTDFREMLAGVD